MSLGLVCHWLGPKNENLLKANELRLGNLRSGSYTNAKICETYVNNVQRHIDFFPTLVKSGIRVFRLTSSLLTLADQVDESCWRNNAKLLTLLKKFGEIVIANNIRLTMHPGQFAVLSSDDDRVVDNAIKDLSIHAFIIDAMGLPLTPHHAINVHGGKRNRSERLIDVIQSLPENIRNRLTLENDESSYSVADLLNIHLQTNVPIVLDTHHHTFNDGGLSLQLAHDATVETWQRSGVKPLQHISNTEPGLENSSFSDRRKHSDYIHYIPEPQLKALRDDSIDVEVEAKKKQLSLLKMSKDFSVPLNDSCVSQL